jgi:hypothetical protein
MMQLRGRLEQGNAWLQFTGMLNGVKFDQERSATFEMLKHRTVRVDNEKIVTLTLYVEVGFDAVPRKAEHSRNGERDHTLKRGDTS